MPGIFAVVHNENIFLLLIIYAGRWRQCQFRGDAESRGKVKFASFPQLALYRDLSLHQFAQLLADREPQTGASVLARKRGVSLVKRLEKVSHLLRAHTNRFTRETPRLRAS